MKECKDCGDLFDNRGGTIRCNVCKIIFKKLERQKVLDKRKYNSSLIMSNQSVKRTQSHIKA